MRYIASHGMPSTYFECSASATGHKCLCPNVCADQDWPDSMVQMMNSSYDFPPRVHHITRWYRKERSISRKCVIFSSPHLPGMALISSF